MMAPHSNIVAPRGRARRGWMAEDGFTLIEMIVVLMMTSILSGLFAQFLVASSQIYVDHNLRRTGHIDCSRAYEQLSQDVREWQSWTAASTATTLDFRKPTLYEVTILFWSRKYYDRLRVGYNIGGGALTYQRGDFGNWNNLYSLIGSGLGAGTAFTSTSPGGMQRIKFDVRLTINGNPMRYTTTVFPRSLGAQ